MSLGLLDLSARGAGFLRRRACAYQPDRGDAHVGERLIKQHGLRPGDEIDGTTKDGQRGQGPTLETITSINGRPPAEIARRADFAKLAAVHPFEALPLTYAGAPDLTGRVIDLLCPLGKGSRALIVAPAKAGKTTTLRAIAEGLRANHPSVRIFFLLVDERPEEVYEMESLGIGEVAASSFDQDAKSHVALAELTLERARRIVEQGGDAVIIVDSLTRLARAYNTARSGSGRTLSGGLDADAMERPKRFFGSARAVDPRQGTGSLTIIATALVDTGSRMDQVNFEEFKGTGNSALVLSRELAERRVLPDVDLTASATRKEEKLMSPELLGASHELRRRLAGSDPVKAMKTLQDELRRAPTTDALVQALAPT